MTGTTACVALVLLAGGMGALVRPASARQAPESHAPPTALAEVAAGLTLGELGSLRGPIVIDAGHGGPDYGAHGPAGLREKDLALAVALKIGRELERAGFEVLYTRVDDVFVSLPERTRIANEARAGLFLSIHANASSDRTVRGPETYFLSLNASDDEARRVALTENRVFDQPDASVGNADIVGAILGDLIRTDHLRASSAIALEIQRRLDLLPGPSRGVKQAPFVVLRGVNMPAALLEIGFLTHAKEERKLRSEPHQAAIAKAVTAAVQALRLLPAAPTPADADLDLDLDAPDGAEGEEQ